MSAGARIAVSVWSTLRINSEIAEPPRVQGGSAMKALELLASRNHCWRKISITLIDPLVTETAVFIDKTLNRAEAPLYPQPHDHPGRDRGLSR